MTKSDLRKTHLSLRQQMTTSEVEDKSRHIVKRLQESPWLQEADVIYSYMAFNNEVNLAGLNDLGKGLALPQVLDATTMVFRLISGATQFKKSAYGVMEPINGMIVEPTERSIILLPGACFDMNGNRIGYGAGYYDRYLNHCQDQGTRVGVCYDHQLTSSIPAEIHDARLDAIVTESQVVEL